MSLFGAKSTNAQASTKLLGYQVQTSIYGRPIPRVYGQVRVPGNVIWVGNWQANPVQASGGKGNKGGKGGKGGTAGQLYTYSTAIVIGLCQGPIRGIGYVWIDKTRLSVNSIVEQLNVPFGGGSVTPGNADTFLNDNGVNVPTSYTNTVHDYGAPGPVTISGIQGIPLTRVAGTPGPGQYSVDTVTGTYTFHADQGGSTVDIGYSWFDPNALTDGNPINNLSFSLFTGEIEQAAWDYMVSNFPSQALGYSGLANLANQQLDLGVSGALHNFGFEVLGVLPFGGGIVDSSVDEVILDFLTNPTSGVGFPIDAMGDLTELRNYCLANGIFISIAVDSQRSAASWLQDWLTIANCEAIWSEGKLKFRAYGDKTAIGNGVQFNPTTSPIYDLDDDDFLAEPGTPPINVSRPTVRDAYNSVTVEWVNRGNNYSAEPVEERDSWAVDTYGLRPASPVQLHSITQQAVAAKVGSTIVQRSVYVRAKYKFKLSAIKYCLLEPMDMVTITQPELGFYKVPVKIKSIQETDQLELEIEAEEFPWGTATPTLYPKQVIGPFGPLYFANPGNTLPVIFYEPDPPAQVTRGDKNTLLIGLTGAQNWGGCHVYVSTDGGNSYTHIGKQTGPSTVGYLSADLPAVTDPDNTSTLAVDMSVSQEPLISYSEVEENALIPLCVVDKELIAYRTATLTGLNHYGLTFLRRAVYESPLSAHSTGAPFGFFDDSMFAWKFLDSYVNTTVYFKFLSFNRAGLMNQKLDQVQAYPWFIHGERSPYPWSTNDPATPIAPDNLYRHPNFGIKQKALSDVNGNITPQFLLSGFGIVNQFTQLTVAPGIVSAVVNPSGGSIKGNQVVTLGVWAQASDSKFTTMSLISVEVPPGSDSNSILLTVTFGNPGDQGWVAITTNRDAGWSGPNAPAITGGFTYLFTSIGDLVTPVPDQEFDRFVVQGRTGYAMGANGSRITSISDGVLTFFDGGTGQWPTSGQWVGRTASCYGLQDQTMPLPILDTPILDHTDNSITIDAAAAALLSVGDLVMCRLTATGFSSTRLEDATLLFWQRPLPDGTFAAGWEPGFVKGKLAFITRGTGAGQITNVTDNDAIGVDLAPAFDIAPDATSEFIIINSNVDYQSISQELVYDDMQTPVELALNIDNSWRHFFVQVLTENVQNVRSLPQYSPYRLIFSPGFAGATSSSFSNPQETFYVGFGPGGVPLNIPAGGTSTLALEQTPGTMYGWDAVVEVAGASDIVFNVKRKRGTGPWISIFGAGPKIVIPAGSTVVAQGTTFDLANADILPGDLLQLFVDSVDATTPGQRATVNLYWKNVPVTAPVSQ